MSVAGARSATRAALDAFLALFCHTPTERAMKAVAQLERCAALVDMRARHRFVRLPYPVAMRLAMSCPLSVVFALQPMVTLAAFSSFVGALQLAADKGDRARS